MHPKNIASASGQEHIFVSLLNDLHHSFKKISELIKKSIIKKIKSKKTVLEPAAAELTKEAEADEESVAEVAATAGDSVTEEKSGDMKKRLCFAALFCSLFGLISATGNFLQMLGARNLPAVLLYPVVTGGSIILSALFGLLFFKEKLDKFNIISIVLAFAATVLFLF